MLRSLLLAGGLMALASAPAGWAAPAQDVPAALFTDPPRDPAHPARLEQIRYSTGGVAVPARLFVAAGPALHPTVLLLHGFPGTELNLDLARVLQRAGWNVLAVHYRGVWGAPGQFSFSHVVEDAHAALAWLRSDAGRARGVDPARIVALGHSMGGFATAMLGDDPALAGYVLISAADLTGWTRQASGAKADPAQQAEFADDASYTNADVPSLVADVRDHAEVWNWTRRAAQIAPRPALVISSDDGLAEADAAAAAAITAAGGKATRLIHFTTDHSYNDHRVALATTVLDWLATSFPAPTSAR